MVRAAADHLLKARLVLCDRTPEVVEAWRVQFEELPEVEIRDGSVLEAGCDACICPGNSFGFMDSGLALSMSEALGWQLQDALRELIRTRFDGELLVGQAIVLPTGKAPAFLAYAPTVRTPYSTAGTVNAYLAMRGALLAVRDFNQASAPPAIQSVAVPGLCTGAGGMHPLISARQIRYACEQVMGMKGYGDRNLSQLARREQKLKTLPIERQE